MASSSQKPVSFTAPVGEVDEWEKQAEKQDLSRSEWVRQRIRAGMRLWDSEGDFNPEELDRVLQTKQNSASGSSTGNSAESQVRDLIMRNLSVTEPIEVEELQEIVIDVMNGALYDLQQESQVEHVPGEGYRQLKNDD